MCGLSSDFSSVEYHYLLAMNLFSHYIFMYVLQQVEDLCGAEGRVDAPRALVLHVREEVVLKHLSTAVVENASLVGNRLCEQADLKWIGPYHSYSSFASLI